MTNPIIETLHRVQSIIAPTIALLDRVRAFGATPPTIAELNRRVAAQIGALKIEKD